MTDMTDETKGDVMKLEQVSHMLRCASQDMVNPRYRDKFKSSADSIDAHLVAQSAMRVDEAVLCALTRLYTAGYKSGHHYTVEGGYTDVYHQDGGTYFREDVTELLEDSDYAAIQAALAKE